MIDRTKILAQTDIAIITIREDEEQSILKRMRSHTSVEGTNRIYATANIPVRNDRKSFRRIATVRCGEEGQSAAQAVTRDVIDDLNPAAIFVVGIGGGFPCSEVSLGDVVVATRVQDLRIMALLNEEDPEFDTRGGPVAPEVERVVTALGRIRLGRWNSPSAIGLQPSVKLSASNFYGPSPWKQKTKRLLIQRFGRTGHVRHSPKFTTGALVSTDYLVKDVLTVSRWNSFVRKAIGCEMEMAGVFQGARKVGVNCHVYGIRGISDVIGFVRSSEWIPYACETAAAFTFALIRTGLIAEARDESTPHRPVRAQVPISWPLKSTTRKSKANDYYSSVLTPGLGFIDRGDTAAAVTAILAGASFERAEPAVQVSVLSTWQKFGFIDEAKACLEALNAKSLSSRLTLEQEAHYRLIGLKVLSQTGQYSQVIDTYKVVERLLARTNLHSHRAAVLRRVAVAFAAFGNWTKLKQTLSRARAIEETLPSEHSKTTGKVFAAITLALGPQDRVESALEVLRDAPESYLSSGVSRSHFQAHPLKSAVMCLFSEAAVRLAVVGESTAAWTCLTACYVLAPIGTSHPNAEGYAELLGLVRCRYSYGDLFALAMNTASPQRRQIHAKYPNIPRHLSACQSLPDLVREETSAAWSTMRRQLDQAMARVSTA